MTQRPTPKNPSLPPDASPSRYEVGPLLGEGGMATVYRAFDRTTGEWCALKVLLPRFNRRRGIRARFAAEADAMMRMRHRNVIRVFDANLEGSRPYMAMELAEGGCLVDWVELHGPMPPRMAVDVAIQICKGIGAAHRAGVIHRDIKPHNILVNRRGVCKITDFGIAQFDDEAASLTQTGSVMGTLGYIAPEQRANAKDVDGRSDIYSIGATLFTLVTARTTMDLFFADQEPELLAGVPELLKPIILESTRYRREDRYPTVKALAKVLYDVRALLPEDPPDTPSIVMRPEVEDTPNPQHNRTPSAEVPPREAPSAATPAPIQSRQPAPRHSSTVGGSISISGEQPPALIAPMNVRSAPAAARREAFPHLSGEVSDQTSMPPREALLREVVQPKPRVVPRVRPLRVALLSGALVLVLAAYLTVGVSTVDAQHNSAVKARDAWIEAVQRESELLDDLVALGASREPLEEAWDRLWEVTEPDIRAARADSWLELVKRELVEHAPTTSGARSFARARDARGRIQRLDAERTDWLVRRQGWQEATATPHGTLAVLVGLAVAPDEP